MGDPVVDEGRDAAVAIAREAEAAGDLDRALGYWRALAQIEPENPRWLFEEVRLLKTAGRIPEASVALAAALKRFPGARRSETLRAILPELKPSVEQAMQTLGPDCPTDEELKRAPISDEDGAGDFIVAEGGRRTAVIVFTGLADRMVMPLPVFDRYLAALDLTAIYLRDRRRIGFFDGVKSLGEDYDQTIDALKALTADRGIETVHTVGNSAGGMGAVSYGLDLGAARVLAFSAPVALVADTKNRDYRTAVFADRILHGVPEERRDFRARLTRQPGSEIHLYYGSEMPEDTYHATFLEGQPGVTLHPLAGLSGHGALFQVSQVQGGLRALFREMFGERD